MAKFKRKSFEERQAEIKENYEKLLKGVKETVSDPDDYKRYLDFISKFPKRSIRNQLLIYMQKPDAQLVAGMKTWNKFGRQIKRGSKGIKIFAPITKTEKVIDEKTQEEIEMKVVKGFKMVHVFDVKDTTGVPLPTTPLIPKNVKESEFAEKTFIPLVEMLRKELPIVLDKNYSDSSNGYYSRLEHKIVINANAHRDITNQFKTLIHEYAHSIFHSVTGKYVDYDRDTKEVQAESMAYLTAKSFGMDTSDYSFAYIKGWAAGKDESLLLAYQEDIQRESANLINKIEDMIIEQNITFDVPVILETNTTTVEEGEEPISLIQYGDTFTIAKGEFKESSLNNLQEVKKLGQSFENREIAETAFEFQKGHIPLSGVNVLDKEKGTIHLYERKLKDPKDNTEKNMYFVGVSSFTNIKLLCSPTDDRHLAMKKFQHYKDIGIGEHQRVEKDRSMRDQDKDGLTDLQEMRLGSNPLDPDTDRDGIPDNIDISPNNPQKNTLELDISL